MCWAAFGITSCLSQHWSQRHLFENGGRIAGFCVRVKISHPTRDVTILLVGLSVIEIGRGSGCLWFIRCLDQNASFFYHIKQGWERKRFHERAKNRTLFKEGLILLSHWDQNNISETGGKADKMDLTACTPRLLERIRLASETRGRASFKLMRQPVSLD